VLVVGVVLGVGIFRSPPVVAASAGDGLLYMALWGVGGLVTLLGALSYVELATAYPDAGGEYHIVGRAYGARAGFLVGWARMTVIQTGSIAILAYVVGDYLASLLSLGDGGSALFAAGVVIALTTINALGLRPGRATQYLLTGGAVAVTGAVIVAGFLTSPAGGVSGAASAPLPGAASPGAGPGSLGVALIFVLLAFGGWSEGAYLSAEVRERTGGVGRVLVWGVGSITLLYLLVNAAYLAGLGVEGVAGSEAIATDLAERAFGPWGGRAVGAAVVLAALSSANATVITGARSNYALGRDWTLFRPLGRWAGDRQTPVAALVLQGVVALALVGFGAVRRSGFEAMVAYTAPVFWLVLMATAAAVPILRRRDPGRKRPYRVPAYPLTPVLFCAAAAYMTYSAVRNAGDGALLGIAVMVLGLPFLLAAERRDR